MVKLSAQYLHFAPLCERNVCEGGVGSHRESPCEEVGVEFRPWHRASILVNYFLNFQLSFYVGRLEGFQVQPSPSGNVQGCLAY